MYSEKIKIKVDEIFNNIKKELKNNLSESYPLNNDDIKKVSLYISSIIVSRSQNILSDMLFDLNNSVLQTPFFTEISRKNKFREVNLRKEIFSKYHFISRASIDYQETSRIMRSIKIGSGVFAVGGIAEIGAILTSGLSLSSLVPAPIVILVAVALGAAILDFFLFEPNRSRKSFSKAVDKYLSETQQQFLNWFDEIENYFNKRVDQIKNNLKGKDE